MRLCVHVGERAGASFEDALHAPVCMRLCARVSERAGASVEDALHAPVCARVCVCMYVSVLVPHSRMRYTRLCVHASVCACM